MVHVNRSVFTEKDRWCSGIIFSYYQRQRKSLHCFQAYASYHVSQSSPFFSPWPFCLDIRNSLTGLDLFLHLSCLRFLSLTLLIVSNGLDSLNHFLAFFSSPSITTALSSVHKSSSLLFLDLLDLRLEWQTLLDGGWNLQVVELTFLSLDSNSWSPSRVAFQHLSKL